jgi:hypothetical protein
MHWLLSPSFVPDVALLELRDLTRYRKKRIGEQASERNRIIKLLEASNVRLASVASDPLGKAGRAIIEALLVGEQTAEQIAQTAGRKLRTPTHDIARAIDGVVTDTTRFLLRQMLGHIDQVAVAVADIDARIADLLKPMSQQCALLAGVPGINSVSASGVLAEIGADMSVFPSADASRASGRTMDSECLPGVIPVRDSVVTSELRETAYPPRGLALAPRRRHTSGDTPWSRLT